ncbi:MAG: DUF3572 domain-containing protein [Pseudomonadota bacterium]
MVIDDAETIALQALAWIAEDEDLLPAFLAISGAEAGALREAAGDPGFLGAVLDFVLAEDPRVLAFCEMHGLPPEDPAEARAMLPGGDLMHWT